MTTRTILFLIIASTWAGIHMLALQTELYWYYWWFDIPMHFFGGTVVALGFFVLMDIGVAWLRGFQSLLEILVGVFLVAVLWELYELGIGIPIKSDFWFDTSLDLVMGLGGGIVGWFLATKISEMQ